MCVCVPLCVPVCVCVFLRACVCVCVPPLPPPTHPFCEAEQQNPPPPKPHMTPHPRSRIRTHKQLRDLILGGTTPRKAPDSTDLQALALYWVRKHKRRNTFLTALAGQSSQGRTPPIQGQTRQNGEFIVQFNRDGSRFIPGTGLVCPWDGSCLP